PWLFAATAGRDLPIGIWTRMELQDILQPAEARSVIWRSRRPVPRRAVGPGGRACTAQTATGQTRQSVLLGGNRPVAGGDTGARQGRQSVPDDQANRLVSGPALGPDAPGRSHRQAFHGGQVPAARGRRPWKGSALRAVASGR